MNEQTSCCGGNCHDPAQIAQPQTIAGESIGPQSPPVVYLPDTPYGMPNKNTGPMDDVDWESFWENYSQTGPLRIIHEDIEFVPAQKLKVKKLHPDAIIPTRAHNTDAGYDLYALEDVYIWSGQTKKIRTGVAIQPPKGHYGRISERSSMGAKGLSIRGGVCDEGYTGEYVVCMTNTKLLFEDSGEPYRGCQIVKFEEYEDGSGPNLYDSYKISKGDKIAQVVFHKYGDFDIEEVEEFEETERSDKGFGSSGT